MTILWLKAIHLIFMVTWFAGLFYLPRLFVYHAQEDNRASFTLLATMEKRLFIMMSIGAIGTLLFGISLLASNMPAYMSYSWIHWKLLLVAALLGYHGYCWLLMHRLRDGSNEYSHKWLRWFNEAPSIALIAIVILAVIRPS